jgi:hypothetical protein
MRRLRITLASCLSKRASFLQSYRKERPIRIEIIALCAPAYRLRSRASFFKFGLADIPPNRPKSPGSLISSTAVALTGLYDIAHRTVVCRTGGYHGRDYGASYDRLAPKQYVHSRGIGTFVGRSGLCGGIWPGEWTLLGRNGLSWRC